MKEPFWVSNFIYKYEKSVLNPLIIFSNDTSVTFSPVSVVQYTGVHLFGSDFDVYVLQDRIS